jgi:hypothetical protein
MLTNLAPLTLPYPSFSPLHLSITTYYLYPASSDNLGLSSPKPGMCAYEWGQVVAVNGKVGNYRYILSQFPPFSTMLPETESLTLPNFR